MTVARDAKNATERIMGECESKRGDGYRWVCDHFVPPHSVDRSNDSDEPRGYADDRQDEYAFPTNFLGSPVSGALGEE